MLSVYWAFFLSGNIFPDFRGFGESGMMYKKELNKYYWKLLVPALALILISELLKTLDITNVPIFEQKYIFSAVIFALAALSSIGLPIVRRLVFVDKVKNLKEVDALVWMKFEKQSLQIALLTPYFFFIASALQFISFFYTVIFLLALYACYYYFPSEKRVHFEMRIFRINKDKAA